MPINPFRRCRRIATAADRTRERMPLSIDQASRVNLAAPQRVLQRYVEGGLRKKGAGRRSGGHARLTPDREDELRREGQRRAIAYAAAQLSALRANELRGIEWRDVDLAEASWTIRAEVAKDKRRTWTIPMHSRRVEVLRAEREQQAREPGRPVEPGERVFHVAEHVAEHVKVDAAFAGVPVKDEHGRRLDFHSFRATFATWLTEAGVSDYFRDLLMRLWSPSVSRTHYVKGRRGQVALERIPRRLLEVPGMAPRMAPDSARDHSARCRKVQG